MYVFSNCRNEFLIIISVYVKNNPTVRGLTVFAYLTVFLAIWMTLELYYKDTRIALEWH